MTDDVKYVEMHWCQSAAEGQVLRALLRQARIPVRLKSVQRGQWVIQVDASRVEEARQAIADAEQSELTAEEELECPMADLTACASEREAAGIERILSDLNIGAIVAPLSSDSRGPVVVRVPAERLAEAREAIGISEEDDPTGP